MNGSSQNYLYLFISPNRIFDDPQRFLKTLGDIPHMFRIWISLKRWQSKNVRFWKSIAFWVFGVRSWDWNMIYTWYGATFSQKGPHPKTHPLKTTLGRKKTTKSDFWQISPEWCALWVHILVRPFSWSKALIYTFDPSWYHLPHIYSTDDILEHVLSKFRKWHFFRHVFSRKKWLF